MSLQQPQLPPFTSRNDYKQFKSLKHLFFWVYGKYFNNSENCIKLVLKSNHEVTKLAVLLGLITLIETNSYDKEIELYQGTILLDWLITINNSKQTFHRQQTLDSLSRFNSGGLNATQVLQLLANENIFKSQTKKNGKNYYVSVTSMW
jgi:hypothetical protein